MKDKVTRKYKEKIIQISAGSGALYGLSNTGRVYAWAWRENKWMTLSKWAKLFETPKK